MTHDTPRTQRTAVHSAMLVVIGIGPLAPLGFMPAPVQASQAGTTIGVSVQVVSNAILRSEFQERRLSITRTDVDRGYVDAMNASRFSVSTNSRYGYQLVFHCVVDLFDTMQVSGLRAPVQLGAEGGVVVQRGLPSPGAKHDLNFRFFLSSHV